MEGVAVRNTIISNDRTNELELIDVIYVNGTWVDVTGRIRIENPETSVMKFGPILDTNTMFLRDEDFGNIPVFQSPKNSSDSVSSTTYLILSGMNSFDNKWNSGQSRLIQITGTVNVSSSLLTLLQEQKINIYANAENYVYLMLDEIVYDTS